ncbi:MAG: DUF1523 family protein [Granulosicoccus sp.]
MKTLLTVRNILFAIPVIILLAALHYALPQVDVVRAVGVEIKRIDSTDSDASQPTTRDVYQLQMETPDGSPRVYRNEDNMLYLKFDSANLQAQVQSAAADKQLLALRHYGWRLTLFSAFPNAVKAWPVEEGYRHIPIFNTLVLLALGGIFFLIYRRAKKAVAATRQLVETKRQEREAAAALAAQAPKERENEAKKKEQDEIDAFINNDRGKKP